MTNNRKKGSITDKSKKKTSNPSKGRGKSKAKDDVCVMTDVILTEQAYFCDYDCCCLI